MIDASKLRELWERVIGTAEKKPPLGVDFVYLCGQSTDNQWSVLTSAEKFASTARIACAGHSGSPGFAGFSDWRRSLIEYGIPGCRIVPIHSAEPLPFGGYRSNTMTEAVGVVEYAREQKLQEFAIVAPRWHLTRCYMTFVSVALRRSVHCVIRPMLGTSLDWEERACHSQGTTVGIRADLPAMEMARIFEYHATGDLCDPDDILEQLRNIV